MTETSTNSGASVYLSGTTLIFEIVWLGLVIAGMWMTFAKAGKPGWGAIIPFYNLYLVVKIAGRPGWWLILYFIPVINTIILLIVSSTSPRTSATAATPSCYSGCSRPSCTLSWASAAHSTGR